MVAVDLEGNVAHSLRDESSRYVSSTGVLEYEGQLFIGSVAMHAIGVAPLPR